MNHLSRFNEVKSTKSTTKRVKTLQDKDIMIYGRYIGCKLGEIPKVFYDYMWDQKWFQESDLDYYVDLRTYIRNKFKKKRRKINESFKFTKASESKSNKMYLHIIYEGGDADTRHPVDIELEGIKFSEYENHLDEINKEIEKYKLLRRILDQNSVSYCENYRSVKVRFGEEMAKIYDNVPNDPQSDYQYKCYLDRVDLIGYDLDGSLYTSHVEIRR